MESNVPFILLFSFSPLPHIIFLFSPSFLLHIFASLLLPLLQFHFSFSLTTFSINPSVHFYLSVFHCFYPFSLSSPSFLGFRFILTIPSFSCLSVNSLPFFAFFSHQPRFQFSSVLSFLFCSHFFCFTSNPLSLFLSLIYSFLSYSILFSVPFLSFLSIPPLALFLFHFLFFSHITSRTFPFLFSSFHSLYHLSFFFPSVPSHLSLL